MEGIRAELPSAAQKGINRAIEVQTQSMQSHIEKIDNPQTFERYKQQIEGDQAIKNQVQQFAPRILQQPPPRIPVQPFEEKQSAPQPLPATQMPASEPQPIQQPIQNFSQPESDFQPAPQPVPTSEPAPQPVFPSLWQNFQAAISKVAQ